MEARSFHALPTASVQNKNPCANKFTLDGLLMEVAGANADCAFVSAFAVDSFGGVVQLLAVRRQHALCGKPKQNKKDTT